MGIFAAWGGTVQVRLTSADLYRTLQFLQEKGLELEQLEPIDAMQLQFLIPRRQLHQLQWLCKKRGDSVQVLHHSGLYWGLQGLLKRPVLVLGMLGLLFLSLWAPGRIFFVFVEGNGQVPGNLILEKAQLCGIEFGTQRREIRSEHVKNALLEEIPQLQWVGVNTQGCIAVISVRERSQAETAEPKHTVSSVVAVRDGVIREMTVLSGSPLCTTGQAVHAGQVLISGYTDCGICIRAGNAQGEIFAETVHTLSAIYPAERLQRTQKQEETKKYSLILGKKRINLCNSSGISGGECVRIYSEQYLTLPGGFRLPIAIAVERTVAYETQVQTVETPEEILQPFMTKYIQSQMIGGKILTENHNGTWIEGYYRIDGIYGCYEMIGRVRPEERLDENENH